MPFFESYTVSLNLSALYAQSEDRERGFPFNAHFTSLGGIDHVHNGEMPIRSEINRGVSTDHRHWGFSEVLDSLPYMTISRRHSSGSSKLC